MSNSDKNDKTVDVQDGGLQEKTPEALKKRKSYHFDILALVLWLVIMWGFLLVMTFTDSPKNSAGIHELLAYTYFFGFTFVYAIFYILALKKGV
jgi:hypothetical protein